MCEDEQRDNTYGCDKCGMRFDWDTEIIWITSAYGVCSECYDKMSTDEKNVIRISNGDEPFYGNESSIKAKPMKVR